MTKLKRLLETMKKETVLVGRVERRLLGKNTWMERRPDVIHPSELAADDWCPRAVYFRIKGRVPDSDPPRMQTEVIWAQGHEYHRKWQNWAWDVGLLAGRYRCLKCGRGDWGLAEDQWYAQSPDRCDKCSARRKYLQYGEVPVVSEKYLLMGRADGDLRFDGERALLEVKSVGIGTVRFDNPKLLGKYTYKVTTANGKEKSIVDLNGLWGSIRRPFNSHIRQVTIYGFCTGVTRAVLVYEFKPTGAVKEFDIQLDYSLIESRLDDCLVVKKALSRGTPPACKKKDGCKRCKVYEDDKTTTESAESAGGDTGGGDGSRPSGQRGDVSSQEAEVGTSGTSGGPDSAGRSGSDDVVPAPDSLDRLREWSAGGGRDRGRDSSETSATS